MEEIILNIDSNYRDRIAYPNEGKFRINFEKSYKNIVSLKIISLELSNTVNYIDSKKNNNWIRLHLPNKINDPTGIKVELQNGLLQVVSTIQNIFNTIFAVYINTNAALETYTVDDLPYAEKYFYFFYLNQDVTLDFDFNTVGLLPATLANKLTIKEGWHSVYGFMNQIDTYITAKYNERLAYKTANPSAIAIDLDNGNFSILPFDLYIFDRRFRSVNITLVPPEPTNYDCIRIDTFTPSVIYNVNSLSTNLANLRHEFYKLYINDTSTFIVEKVGSVLPLVNMGILDKLNSNNYTIPNGYNYTNEGNLLNSGSKYANNNDISSPNVDSTQIYNMIMNIDLTTTLVSFSNSYTTNATGSFINFYYYYVDPLKVDASTWSKSTPDEEGNPIYTNRISNLLKKSFLREQYFITSLQYNSSNYKATLKKDIAPFEIDFNTYSQINNPIVGGVIDITQLQYPTVGYYLGFRPNLTKLTDKFLLTSVWDETDATILATKIFDTAGNDYVFLRLNDWGYIDFFNKAMFAKLLLPSGLAHLRDDYLNKEYKFRQPTNIQSILIELVDYLGNTIDLNGYDYSFTLEMKQILNTDQKNVYERSNLCF